MKYFFCLCFLAIPFFVTAQNYDCRAPALLTECIGDSINARGGLAGATEFCEGQEVSFLNSSTGTIDSTAYCWGDGKVTVVRGPLGATHTYDFGGDTCLPANRPRTLEVVMVAFRTCAAGITSSYIKTPIRILVKPKVIFGFPQPVCMGTDFSFTNSSCPNAPATETTYLWDFGDGTTSNSAAASITHRYNTVGNFTVSLTVSNRCGPKTLTQIVSVIGLPKAKAEVVSGAQSTTQPFVICVGSSVVLTGNNSLNSSSYLWTSLPTGVNFFPKNDTIVPTVVFNQPGNYSVILKTNNTCNKPSYDTLRFRVLSVSDLTLQTQADGCQPFNYKITTPVAGATYERFLDGTTQGTLDPSVGFTAGYGTHVVIARLQNECGSRELRDTFDIVTIDPVFFLNPATDTTVCRNSALIFLQTTPLGGTITPSTYIIKRGDSLFFNPSVAGVYTLKYQRGSGVCLRETTRKITVENAAQLTLNAQTDECLPFQYKPNPIVTSATYTINGTSFDPNTGFALSQNTSYIVEARLQTACGLLIKKDSFDVSEATSVFFQKPTADTTVCLNSGQIFLDITPIGGNITPSTYIIKRGDSLFFNPSVAGTFPLIYGRGVGACRREASRTIKVENAVQLTLNAQTDECLPFQYKPNPIVAGATYTINGTSFDPNTGFALSQNMSYIVEARLQNTCGSQTKRDSFDVYEAASVFFQKPTADTTICLNSGQIFLDVIPIGGNITPSTYIIKRGDSLFFNPSVAGTFPLIYGRGVGVCRREASRTITVLAAARLSLNVQANKCQPFLYKPNPIVVGANYTFDGVVFDPNAGVQATVSPTPHAVVAALTNLCGSDTQRISFNVTGVVAIQMSSRDTVICRQAGKITLRATSSAGTGKWTTPSAGLSGIVFDPSVAGVGTHTLTFSDGVGECANSQNITVKVGGLANIDAGRDIVLCNTRQVVPFNLPNGQPSGGVFKLNNPFSGQTITQIDPSLFPPSAKVFYVVTDTLCVSYDSLQVTINSISTTNLNAPTAACVGIPVSFGAAQPDPNLSFRIFVNDSLKSTTQPFDYTFRHAGTMRLALEIRNAFGCLDTVQRDIVVKYAPKPMFSVSPNPICHGQNATVAHDTTRNDATTTYAWVFRNQSSSQTKIPPLSMSNIGCSDSIYKLQLTATTGVCPAVVFENNLTVLPKIKAFGAVQGADTVCANNLVRFVNASCGHLTRQTWRIDNQSFTTNLPPDQRFENNTDTLRIVNVQLIVAGDCGSDTTAFRVWVYPLSIKARFSFNRRVSCQPFTVNFRSLTPYSAGQLWDFGDGTTSNVPSVSKTYDSVGVFRVRFRVFHPCGGFDDIIDSITVLATPKTNGLTYEKPERCRENLIRIKPNILNGTLGRVWVEALNLSDSTRNPILLFPQAGSFWVKFEAINATTGCTIIDSGRVIVQSPLQVTATVFWDSCGNGKSAVALNATGGASGYRFSKNDTTTLQNRLFFDNLLGKRNYAFFVRDSIGCWASINMFVPGRDPFVISAGGDETLFLGDSASRRITANYKPTQISWQPVERGIRTPNVIQTIIFPLETTVFTVSATDSLTCMASDSFEIKVIAKRDIGLLNVFSPNNDKVNDIFFPSTSGDVLQINFLRVFDRLGNLIFENKNFKPNRTEEGWDGTFKGEHLLPQTFTYSMEVLFLDKVIQQYKGDITIVR